MQNSISHTFVAKKALNCATKTKKRWAAEPNGSALRRFQISHSQFAEEGADGANSLPALTPRHL